ncbi:DUF488 domain-containing protein [Legionella anisa]|uniref:DUF488 domain-containing protein n=1 Tax=Legionella anisa TaxID=28082 RepID=A0AAX0WQT9_9GAMM|nr:DUF488 domain-containing protein [Legionella anisa]AWN75139.1 DUF488 domain-containing protein [Legionella anisa]KTC68508.1 uroporphyrin-III C- methyltransferase [Legionella anisa]MBN5934486.1 DUF488 domain-containing protein [Legionella anisa]MCW8424645.1 DUF488 domain-containing protein [Legionella anisa]MCW8446236.1 DUF488 domain-containing protein [Legionella anisa]
MHKIKIKRIYETPDSADGYRILVDRLWPRGVKKETAAIDLWLKEVSPSNELRQWFNHEPDKWQEFQKRYAQELTEKQEQLATITTHAKNQTVTLLYSAKDAKHNNAQALLEFIHARKK